MLDLVAIHPRNIAHSSDCDPEDDHLLQDRISVSCWGHCSQREASTWGRTSNQPQARRASRYVRSIFQSSMY
jgi:hypothetical protein